MSATEPLGEQLELTAPEWTPEQVRVRDALIRVRFPAGTSAKRFVGNLESGRGYLSDRQWAYMLLIAHRFRKQIPRDVLALVYQVLVEHGAKLLTGFYLPNNLPAHIRRRLVVGSSTPAKNGAVRSEAEHGRVS